MERPINTFTDTRSVIVAPEPDHCAEQWTQKPSGMNALADLERLELEKQTRDWLANELSYSLTDFSAGAVIDQFHPRRHGSGHISNQFEYLISRTIVPDREPADIATALASLQATTVGEELVLHRLKEAVNFRGLLRRLSEFWETLDLPEMVQKNQQNIGDADRYQFSTKSNKRSLERCIEEGVVVSVPDSGRASLRETIEQIDRDGAIPILEHLKNRKTLEASGFMAGKASLAIHDAVDHVWLSQLAKEDGLFDKFDRLWSGVGSPHLTDLFKREGEAIASIGFGTRYWANIDVGFVPLVTVAQINAHMEALSNSRILEDRHLEAFRLITDLASRPLSRESQSLGFVFSNYLVELDEQRRKFGGIRFRDETDGQILGELNPWSADYLSFFVEVHHRLTSSLYKHRYTTFRVNHALEEWFYSGAAVAGVEFKIDVASHLYWAQRAPELEAPVWTIPDARVQWIASHPGFTAIRDALRW